MTGKSKADLFTPVRVGPYDLPNRIGMAPMTRNRAGLGNVPREINALYYAQRSQAGLIVTEAAPVSPQAIGYPDMPGIYTSEQVLGWKRVTDAVHEKGGLVFLQLFHCGRISHPSLQEDGKLPVAPSAIAPEGDAVTYDGPQPFKTPKEIDTDEIQGIVEQFRIASENALSAGFNGVEIHAANGYLLDQFLQDGTNRRTDRWGGSVQNRARFALEVTEAVVNVWGQERVGIHISPGNPFNSMHESDPESIFSYFVEELNRLGPAYISVSEIDLASPARYNAAPNHITRKLREIFKGIYITNGEYEFESATRALTRGDADLVSFGRLFIANPDLPWRFKGGSPLNTPDPDTFYGGGERGYTDYPALESTREEGEDESS